MKALRVPSFSQPSGWKERPIDVRSEAMAQVGPQRRNQIVGRRIAEWRYRKQKDPERDRESETEVADRKPRARPLRPRFRIRQAADYPNFPKTGRFRWHFRGKEYLRLWEDFLSGKSDWEPPAFREFIDEDKDSGKQRRDPR